MRLLPYCLALLLACPPCRAGLLVGISPSGKPQPVTSAQFHALIAQQVRQLMSAPRLSEGLEPLILRTKLPIEQAPELTPDAEAARAVLSFLAAPGAARLDAAPALRKRLEQKLGPQNVADLELLSRKAREGEALDPGLDHGLRALAKNLEASQGRELDLAGLDARLKDFYDAFVLDEAAAQVPAVRATEGKKEAPTEGRLRKAPAAKRRPREKEMELVLLEGGREKRLRTAPKAAPRALRKALRELRTELRLEKARRAQLETVAFSDTEALARLFSALLDEPRSERSRELERLFPEIAGTVRGDVPLEQVLRALGNKLLGLERAELPLFQSDTSLSAESFAEDAARLARVREAGFLPHLRAALLYRGAAEAGAPSRALFARLNLPGRGRARALLDELACRLLGTRGGELPDPTLGWIARNRGALAAVLVPGRPEELPGLLSDLFYLFAMIDAAAAREGDGLYTDALRGRFLASSSRFGEAVREGRTSWKSP